MAIKHSDRMAENQNVSELLTRKIKKYKVLRKHKNIIKTRNRKNEITDRLKD